MTKKESTLELIKRQAMLPLFYHESAQISLEIIKAIYKGGGRLIEYTNRGSNALENFSQIKKLINTELPGMELGIGTIRNVEDAEAFIAAGADFMVCPVINFSIAEIVHQHNLLWIPGCMTPTEIDSAEKSGAALVKIFPGNILGPSYVSAIKEIFPKLMFMPTGGVEPTSENLEPWFKSGVTAVGMGSKLISKEIMENPQFDTLYKKTKETLGLIASIKEKYQ
jgi:2-dehydro-3-deoxyphosphogluconate aldolase/(4S)-4-hydroxy-2-oxoglutarate aldolase